MVKGSDVKAVAAAIADALEQGAGKPSRADGTSSSKRSDKTVRSKGAKTSSQRDSREGGGKPPLVGHVGEFLKEQRTRSQLSLRQLAELTGVSNPYLSQIERGLRRPSAEVLQQLAKALRLSAEQVYIQAGILHPDVAAGGSVELSILGDPRLSERQKRTLLDVYRSFLDINEPHQEPTSTAPVSPAPDDHLTTNLPGTSRTSKETRHG